MTMMSTSCCSSTQLHHFCTSGSGKTGPASVDITTSDEAATRADVAAPFTQETETSGTAGHACSCDNIAAKCGTKKMPVNDGRQSQHIRAIVWRISMLIQAQSMWLIDYLS